VGPDSTPIFPRPRSVLNAYLHVQGGCQGGRREREGPPRLAQEAYPPPKLCGEDATVDELREENKRLRKQLKRAEMEREIPRKATAYFAKESL